MTEKPDMSGQIGYNDQLQGFQQNEVNGALRMTSKGDMPRSKEVAPKGKGTQTYLLQKRQSQRENIRLFCSWILENQIGLVANLLILLFLTHICFPQLRPFTKLFLSLAYYDASSGLYGRGRDDLYYAIFWVLIFTGVRALVIQEILTPFASWAGIKKKKAKVRFSEQAWLLIYYTCSWSIGMYIAYNSKYWLNPRELWTDFPVLQVTGLVKWFFIVQYAFWLQQIFVINIEERRKDHWQMLAHHIITCSLIFTSYGFYQVKVGVAILCNMDGVDILLALAKSLKYLGFQRICDVIFGFFIVSWFLCRHVAFLIICWSVYADVPGIVPIACFSTKDGSIVSNDGGTAIVTNILQPYLDPGGLLCHNERIGPAFLALLLMLQVITIIWFGMILRVAYRVLSGKGGAEDTRSEDECEEEFPEASHKANGNLGETSPGQPRPSISVPLIEEETNVESPHLSRHSNLKKQYRKSSGCTTGLSISGHGDKKELLGRIGCDKPS